MDTPEWDIFSRIESLEQMNRKFGTIEPALGEVRLIAIWAFLMGFFNMFSDRPSRARAGKDELMLRFRQSGVSAQTLELLEKGMLTFCGELEKRAK